MPNGNYILKHDITVEEPYASDFSGTFDGAGHTVNAEHFEHQLQHGPVF